MDLDTGENTLNIRNSILICDDSGQLVMTTVIILLWLNRSQGIFSALILYSTTTSPTFAPPSHSKAQFLLGTGLDDMFCVKYVMLVIVPSLNFIFCLLLLQVNFRVLFSLCFHCTLVSTKHSQLCTSWFYFVRVCSTWCHLLSSFRATFKKRKPQNSTFVERELRGHMVWWGLKRERSCNRPA